MFHHGSIQSISHRAFGERERESSTYGIVELRGRKKILEKRKAIPVAVEIENL